MQVVQVVLTAPANKSRIGGPGANPVVFTASVLSMDGGPAPRAYMTLPLEIPGLPGGATFLNYITTDGGYRVAQTFPAEEGSWSAIAGWPTGPAFASNSFAVDFFGPQLSLRQQPAPAGGYKRDMLRPLVVEAHEPMDASVTLTGVGGSANLAISGGNFCATRGLTPDANDLCVRLDFGAPAFNTFSGAMTLAVAATDELGNGSTLTTTYGVDRAKWTVTLPTVGFTPDLRAAPALDSRGNLYIAANTSGAGGIVSLTPDAGLRYSLNVGGEVQSLAIAPTSLIGGTSDVVFVASNATLGPGVLQGSLRAFSAESGDPIGTPCTNGSIPTWSAIALYDAGVANGTMTVAAAMVLSPDGVSLTAGSICTLTHTGTPIASGTNANFRQEAPSPAGPLLSAANVVIRDGRLYYQESNGAGGIRIGFADLGNTISRGGSSASLFTGTAMGVAVTPAGLVSAAANSSVANGGLAYFQLPSPASALFENGGYSSARAPTIGGGGSNGFTLVGAGGSIPWVRSTPTGLDTVTFPNVPVGVALPTNATLLTAPIVGTGGLAYLVTGAGRLLVYQAGNNGIPNASPLWSTDLFSTSAAVLAHPTLDCNRREGGNQPGILYAVSTTGTVVAVIVDSERLQGSSPWPRWQRTAGNAGNPGFPANPGCP